MPSRSNKFWEAEPRNSLPLSVRTKMGRRLMGFIYLSSFETVSNASLKPYRFLNSMVQYVKILKRRQLLLSDICGRHYA